MYSKLENGYEEQGFLRCKVMIVYKGAICFNVFINVHVKLHICCLFLCMFVLFTVRLHLVVGVSQTLRRWTEGATYIRQGDHQVGHWPTFLVETVFLERQSIPLRGHIDDGLLWRPWPPWRPSVSATVLVIGISSLLAHGIFCGAHTLRSAVPPFFGIASTPIVWPV